MSEGVRAEVQRSDWDQWWRTAVIYQVYPRSFSDSNNDGLGDVKGIIKRLDYLKKLGVEAIWMSPHYPSPQADAGYDVADYFNVNPEYGTLEEFDELIAEAHARGIKLIIDVVPNHSSDQMDLFQEALAAGPNSPERDMYMFRYSENGTPNNWGSMFGGPAWSEVEPLTGKEEDRGWWYLHLFAPEQPDFNWENPAVHEFFKSYFRFWLDRGIDGFRVDVAHGLVKAEGLPDDDIGPDRWAGGQQADQVESPFWDQPGVHEIYREWRKVLDEYGRDRMLVAEAWLTPEREARYVREDEMSQLFNFTYLKANWNADRVRDAINLPIEANGVVGAPVTWVMSNHDVVRATTRYGYEPEVATDRGIGFDDPQPDRELGLRRAKAMAVFTAGLPGSMYVWQGEELGLPEVTDLPDESRQDPTWLRTGNKIRGRDGCRVPIPWEAKAPNFGFGTGAPWLPQPEYWAEFAADVQEDDPSSTLNLYRKLLNTRAELGTASGSVEWLDAGDERVLLIKNGDVRLVLNMSNKPVEIAEVSEVVVSSCALEVQGGSVEVPANCGAWLK
ncbi:MAG: glycoside hydrolase family 13 protein [Actinomycetaceae bacterium]|nr:glycoside hydrolase family 13 protein [Actinomycetaceae bacterium]